MSAEIRNIRVFILAENRLLREALALLLGKKSGIQVVDAQAFSPHVVAQVVEVSPDLLLADSSALDSPGLQLIAELRTALPTLKVVMIGMEDDRQPFLQAVRQGIMGYVLKDASAMEVASAVRAVAEGRAICPPTLCVALFEFVAEDRPQVFSFRLGHDLGLTRREQQLIQMIDRGLTNKEIAVQLNLSEQTVKNHVHRMLRKLGASDRLTAAELCRLPPATA